MSESKSSYETALIRNSQKAVCVAGYIMSFNGITANNDMDKAELFNTYFYSVFTPPCDVHSLPVTVYGFLPLIEKIDIDEQLVFNTLCSLDSTQATGIDDLHPEIYKRCALSDTPYMPLVCYL